MAKKDKIKISIDKEAAKAISRGQQVPCFASACFKQKEQDLSQKKRKMGP